MNVIKLFEKWKKGLEKSAIKVNIRKTKLMVSGRVSIEPRQMGRFL